MNEGFEAPQGVPDTGAGYLNWELLAATRVEFVRDGGFEPVRGFAVRPRSSSQCRTVSRDSLWRTRLGHWGAVIWRGWSSV